MRDTADTEYVVERIGETEDYIVCAGETPDTPYYLPKGVCNIIQQAPPWRRKKPDIIIVSIPDEIADKLNIP